MNWGPIAEPIEEEDLAHVKLCMHDGCHVGATGCTRRALDCCKRAEELSRVIDRKGFARHSMEESSV